MGHGSEETPRLADRCPISRAVGGRELKPHTPVRTPPPPPGDPAAGVGDPAGARTHPAGAVAKRATATLARAPGRLLTKPTTDSGSFQNTRTCAWMRVAALFLIEETRNNQDVFLEGNGFAERGAIGQGDVIRH